MSKAMEEMINEAVHKKTVELALKMLARGRDSLEEIAEMTGLPLEEVRELAKKEIA